MGDKFENIHNSNIINKSSVQGDFKWRGELIDDELKVAINQITYIVKNQNNPASLAVLKEFQSEIQKPNRKIETIKQCWNALISITPKISKLVDVVKKIESII